MPAKQHAGLTITSVRCAIITISDTRTEADDTAGRLIRSRLIDAGHAVCSQEILPDDADRIASRVRTLVADTGCDAVLTTGGTGIAPRDTTYEAIADLLDKKLDGFGELFRILSYEQVGSAAMLSRAIAGVSGTSAVFAMPGSPKAVELAMDKLILPELGHIAHLLRR